ncbi:hypothetical protein DdX_19654 [Ditylenchus destructor]|uniref:Uncharacterized protein n=1 Tax=Ditylenchus destructor TaxID=166010 RepID=A0AAD4QX77_9BILA|nr:hypothetical protein DdX_19654 [Ditylenchus destructor]
MTTKEVSSSMESKRSMFRKARRVSRTSSLQPSMQALGAGFGSRVTLMPEKQQFYKGKPAFYDPVHQVHYDGNQACLFVPLNEPTTAFDIRGPANQANQLPTAVYFCEGFGQRVLVPEDVAVNLNAQHQGKPAFFDSSKGLFYDG